MVNRDPGRDAQLPEEQGVQTGLTLPQALNFHGVMAEHSRPKDGVALARLCPAIHGFLADWLSRTWMPGTMGLCSGRRSRTRVPGMTTSLRAGQHLALK